MAIILNIETATEVCSVALAKDGELLFLKENKEGRSHASLLTVFIEEIFLENNLNFSDIDAVAVSMGPGSYTGLRIGVSTAKGVCYANSIPLIAVNTLQSMTQGVLDSDQENDSLIDLDKAWFCPMIDARRMEVYSAFFNSSNKCMKEISADIIEKDSYKDILKDRLVIFFGNGSEKCKAILKHENASFLNEIFLSAKNMIPLSEFAFIHKQFEDVAYFEPFYLKDFIATIPKKNIF